MALHTRNGNIKIRLGSVKEIMAMPCVWHTVLLEILCNAGSLPPETKIDVYYSIWRPGHIWITDNDQTMTTNKPHSFLTVINNEYSRERGLGRVVDPEWIDIGLIRTWKRNCESSHGRRCADSESIISIPQARPSWLLDVQNYRLVPGKSNSSFVALSYIWGHRPFLTTRKENIADLQNSGALLENRFLQLIPDTITHAIELVKLLNERFLWVDALCIVQDDESQKHQDIEHMNAIYAMAALTIIASDGTDAYHGLKGVPGVSPSRTTKQTICKLGPSLNLLKITEKDERKRSLYRTRGWTFQEELLSERKLIFSGNRVWWECACATWAEEKLENLAREEGDISVLRKERAYLFDSSVPELQQLGLLICKFNQRDLTFPEDVHNAFYGIASIVKGTFAGGLISGLPAIVFERALLWEPSSQMIRRHSKKLSNACLPSWSWYGWQGNFTNFEWGVCAESLFRNNTHARFDFPQSFRSLVQWNFKEGYNTSSVAIPNKWDEYVKYFDNDLHPCPPGWTRHHITTLGHDWNDHMYPNPIVNHGTPRWLYKQQFFSIFLFWHPVPLPDKEDKGKPVILAPFITCKTRRGWLNVYERISEKMQYFSLRDKLKKWVGVLCVQECPSDIVDDLWMLQTLSGESVELVEVATGSRKEYHRNYSPHDEWNHHERPRDKTCYEFYHVLCVEWKDGIAYRKGVGRVIQSAWEKTVRESINLILG
jgi:Heterokaryon incompatibility protein (HET)